MKKGFSIAEVIISLFVITVGLIAVLGLIASSIRESAAGRNQIIGAQLAQEGIEIIRNVRDSNILSKQPYNEGLGDNNNACADYLTSSENPNFTCPGGSGNYKLYCIPDGSNVPHYRHLVSPAYITPFSRRISINNPVAGEIDVKSKVWWGSSEPTDANCNSANKCVLVQDKLTEHP